MIKHIFGIFFFAWSLKEVEGIGMGDITKQVRERERESACEWIEWNKGCLQSTRGKKKRKSELEGVWSIYAPQFKLFDH